MRHPPARTPILNARRGTLARLYERHKNPLSWLVRPPLGAIMFYGAWQHSWPLLSFGLVGVATSWCWFPRPRKIRPWVERFIDIEREYLTPPWTAPKLLGLVAVAVFLVVVTCALWRHDAVLGLSAFAFGALCKAVWSVIVARDAGIPAAIIGVMSAAIAGGILYWFLG